MKNGNYSLAQLEEKLDLALKNNTEGNHYDFKGGWSVHKHDYLAMLNILDNEDCFIFIGIDDKCSIAGLDDKQCKDQNSINNLLKNIHPSPLGYVFLNNISKNGKTIQVISFEGRNFKPYLPIDKGIIVPEYYIRHNSASEKATYLEIEELYKYRFRIDEDIRTKLLKSLLLDIDNWICQHSSSRNIEAYYLKNPDFKVIANATSFQNGENKRLGYLVDLVYNTTSLIPSFLMIEYDNNSILVPTFLRENTNKRHGIHYNVILLLNTAIRREESREKKTIDIEESCKNKGIIWQ